MFTLTNANFSIKHRCFVQLSSSILIGKRADARKNQLLAQHLPDFLWLIRDVSLELPQKENGAAMTPTEYLRMNVLADESGTSLLSMFPNLKGAMLPHPGKNPKRCHEQNSEFFQQMETEIVRLKECIQPKKGFSGAVINGPLLVDLIHEYVKAINDPGAIPNLEVSWHTVTDLQLSKSKDELVSRYTAEMEEHTTGELPIEEGSLQSDEEAPNTLYGIHIVIMKKCLDHLDHEVRRLLLPVGSHDRANSKIKKKQEGVKSEFSQRIAVYNHSNKLCRGELYTFVQKNHSKSCEHCRKVFDFAYSRMHNIGCITIKELMEEYHREAIGPAKDLVLNEEIKYIPGPPSDVEVLVDKSESTVLTLFWNLPEVNPESSKDYDIQVKNRGLEWKMTFYKRKISQDGGIFAIIAELKPNTEYCFRIRGKNEKRCGEYSKCVVSKTKPALPNTPPKPEFKQVSPEEAVITFLPLKPGDDNGSSVKTIQLESDFVSNSRSCGWKKTHIHVERPKQFPLEYPICLESHDEVGEYFYRVKYGNEAGYSEASDITKVNTCDLFPGKPGTPYVDCSVTSLTFKWQPPDLHPKSVQSYEVRVRGKGKEGWTIYTSCKLSLTIESLQANTEYEYEIQAKNHRQQGGTYKNIISTDASPPNQPKRPVLQVIDSEKIEVSIQKLKEVEENGKPVTQVKIEKSYNHQYWEHSNTFEIDSESDKQVKEKVELCSITSNNDVVVWWYYRVSMKNEKGWSRPSEETQLEKSDLIPSAPRHLQIIKDKCGPRTITVKWKAPLLHASTVENYLVMVCIEEQEEHSVCVSPPYQIPNVTPNTVYTIQVKSRNGHKNGTCSDRIKHTTPFAPPNAPERNQIMVEVKSATDAELHVEVPQLQEGQKPVTHIIVQKLQESDWIQEAETAVECRPGTVMDLTTNYFKHMRILFKSEAGISEPSAIVNVPSSSFIPGEPMNLRVTKCASTSVTLCWNKPQVNAQTATKYSIEIKKESEGQWKTHYSVCEMQSEVTGLDPCSKIEFRVCAQNNQQSSGDYCKPLQITTLPKTPGVPGIKMMTYRSAKLAISKADIQSNISVSIETCEEKGKWTQLAKLNSKDMEENVENPLICYCTVSFSGTPVKWRLQSFSEHLKSEYSDVVKLEPDQFIPGAPTELEAIDTTSNSVTLTWKNPKNPQSVAWYKIKVRMMQDLSEQNTYRCDPKNEYTIENLRMATKYLFEVYAMNKHCNKGEPATVEVETMCPIPGPPINLRLAGATQFQIKLRWGPPSENAHAVGAYEVYFRKCGKSREFEMFARVLSDRRSVVKPELKPGRNYEFRVCSISKRGICGGEAECHAKTKQGTGFKVAAGSAAAVPTLGAGAVAVFHALKDDKDVQESP